MFRRNELIILVYVDDLLIIRPRLAIDEFKLAIASKFKCKDLSLAKYILGLKLAYTSKFITLL